MSRIAEKRAAKITHIHDVAAPLFAERGFAATRMEDVAAAAGIKKPSLYYYFDSKEELLTSLVESRVGVALDRLSEIVSREDTATNRVRAAFGGHLTVFQEHADIYTIFNSERLHSISTETAEKVDGLGREYERLWEGLLAEGMTAGEFRSDLDPPVVVKAILGATNTTLAWYQPGGRLTIDEVADRFTDLFLSGLLT